MKAPQLGICLALGAGLAWAQSSTPLEIRGAVVEDGVGLAGATVTLYEFGHTPTEATSRNVFATKPGRFRIGGLAPSEYRVFALMEDLRRRLGTEELARVLNRAEKVTLERGSSQSISLKIAEP